MFLYAIVCNQNILKYVFVTGVKQMLLYAIVYNQNDSECFSKWPKIDVVICNRM